MLGEHAVLHGTAAQTCLTRKQINFSNIDKEKFVDKVSALSILALGDDANTVALHISDSLYACVESSSVVAPEGAGDVGGVGLGRWERLSEDADDARMWKAISWRVV